MYIMPTSNSAYLHLNSSESDEEDPTLHYINRAIKKNEEYQSCLLQTLQNLEARSELNNLKLELYDYLKKRKKNSYKRRFWYDQIGFYPYDDAADRVPEALRILKLIKSQQKKSNISNFLSKIMQEIDENLEDYDEEEFSIEINAPKTAKNSKLQPILNEYMPNLPRKDPKEVNWVVLAKKLNAETLKTHNNSQTGAIDYMFGKKVPSEVKTPLITGLQLYKTYINYHGLMKLQNNWSQEDDEVLAKAVLMHGTEDWKQISNYLDGKDTGACFQRWYKYVNPSITKGKWSLIEDVKLTLYLEYFGKGKWSSIAKKFHNRTDVQIRERWCNILDPNLKIGNKWQVEEDELLLKEAPLNEFKWSLVAKKFPGRTDNQCSRRFRKLERISKRKIKETNKIRTKKKRKIVDISTIEKKEEFPQPNQKKYSLKEALMFKLPIFTIMRYSDRVSIMPMIKSE